MSLILRGKPQKGQLPPSECGESRYSRYIFNVLRMLDDHRRFFLWTTLAALALRLFFVLYHPAVTDDSHLYLNLATNWLQHDVYGRTDSGQIEPTDTRLPGYPAFLAAILWIFGTVRAVFITQVLIDVATCLVIADLARRTIPNHFAGRVAFALAATCPFLANYAAAVLTETLEIFFAAVALDCVVAGLDRIESASTEVAPPWPVWTTAGSSIAACILLRPDGGILLAAVGLYLAIATYRARSGSRASSIVRAGIIIAAVALAPLVPWTIRNFRTLHHFQPLAPRYATDPDETTPRGFNQWVRTWMVDYVSVQEIYWNVPGVKIDASKLPSRALDGSTRDDTLALIADYNESQDLTPELDARFAALAVQRIRAHPVRYYFELPMLRIADMWLRPRTELLPPDPRWWELNDDALESAVAIGFGLLNLTYVVAALLALILLTGNKGSSGMRYLGLLGGFVLLRSMFLGTIENPETRYTLECYPVLLVWAAAFFAAKLGARSDAPIKKHVTVYSH